ncbi:MAG TPA: accessory factor UbiK family protein [Gammaproteobacteria bacterium]|jgi:BMFP domain-containing protein YqiC
MNEAPQRPQIDELARQLANAVPKNLRALGEDLEKNFRALLLAGFERMDLVTREDFDLQAAVLERTREKLEALEDRIARLENSDTTQ